LLSAIYFTHTRRWTIYSCFLLLFEIRIQQFYKRILLGIDKNLRQEDEIFFPAIDMIDLECTAYCAITSI
ncbi:hypothetical protein MXB_2615, partial [Myxobolus squamalis]